MKKKTKSSGNVVGIMIAFILLVVGVALCFTVVGALIGVPLIIIALCMGGKRQKIWLCKSCGVAVPRA